MSEPGEVASPDTQGLGEPATGFGRWVRNLELGLISLLFLALVVLGLAQIGLRNLADSALPWADPAMRAAVLWLAMLSAVLAAGEARHIRIDVLGRLLPAAVRGWVDRLLFLMTAGVCLVMAWASLKIVRIELEFADLAFLGVPRWVVLVIVPICFALMALRFLRRAVFVAGSDGRPIDGPDRPGTGGAAGRPRDRKAPESAS